MIIFGYNDVAEVELSPSDEKPVFSGSNGKNMQERDEGYRK